MSRSSTYNILMYSHDTFGLGHIRRTMAVASHLLARNINILILTGSPIAGRFWFPDQIDFVRIPGMIKKTNEEYLPLSIKINSKHALEIRKNIITATAKTFRPHLFIVDKEPLGLKKEVLPTLQWLRRCRPKTRTILGLRDIMDNAETVRKDWEKKGVYEALDKLYSEIWVYGIRHFYNPEKEYAIPETISKKIIYTGYIPRKIPSIESVRDTRKEHHLKNNEKLVVVTIGGGGDGFTVIDTFLSMLESEPRPHPFKSILITGPFMPARKIRKIRKRAKKVGAVIYRFYNKMERILGAADIVVSMGGYNTICEILSQKTLSLVIPRETPRKEQLIRARVFHGQNLVDYIHWQSLTPQLLRAKIFDMLEHQEVYNKAISEFQLTGFQVMRQRLKAFRNNEP